MSAFEEQEGDFCHDSDESRVAENKEFTEICESVSRLARARIFTCLLHEFGIMKADIFDKDLIRLYHEALPNKADILEGHVSIQGMGEATTYALEKYLFSKQMIERRFYAEHLEKRYKNWKKKPSFLETA